MMQMKYAQYIVNYGGKMKYSKWKIEILVFIGYVCFLCIFLAAFGYKKKLQEQKEPISIITETEEENQDNLSYEHNSDNVIKFQETYSMDWDFIDAGYLLKIAEYHGGSVEDRAYTILVTLYKVFDEQRSIEDVVLEELYENDGLLPGDFEEIVPGDMTKQAMNKILYEKYDNCNGSVEYKEFHKTSKNNVDK